MSGLQGRVALVTGAGSGIGLALATGLAGRGCRVVLADLHRAEAEAAALAERGLEALGLRMDVTSEAEIDAAVAQIRTLFGGLDILVNNAGLFANLTRAPLEDLPLEEWDAVFAVNVTGVFRVVRATLPLLRSSGVGRIINITSATVESAPPRLLHYVGSKGALKAMTRAMARELGPDDITVNSIAPGFTLSANVIDSHGLADPQVERARQGRAIRRDLYPRDLVGATCFLAGDDAQFITGQMLVVDGGLVLH